MTSLIPCLVLLAKFNFRKMYPRSETMRTVSVLTAVLTIPICFQGTCKESVVKLNSCSASALVEL